MYNILYNSALRLPELRLFPPCKTPVRHSIASTRIVVMNRIRELRGEKQDTLRNRAEQEAQGPKSLGDLPTSLEGGGGLVYKPLSR
jgi:hypothetical protein